MEKIKLLLDFGSGPIWKEYIDPKTMEEFTKIKAIDENKELQKLNDEIQEMYSSYYESNSHDMPIWFNKEKQKAEKSIMLDKIHTLKSMLEEINDGSFEIDDQVTPEYEDL